MLTRRTLLKRGAQLGLASATTSLWSNSIATKAFAQMSLPSYKAIVIITMEGGNDGNNVIVPMDSNGYAEYARIRGPLAIPIATLIPLNTPSGQPQYGLHPALVNVAKLFNQQRAAVVANVGPLVAPVTKATLSSGKGQYPDSLFSHPDGVKQWESASGYNGSLTGWGGRIADLIAQQSGSLPPVLNCGLQSLFTVGEQVQAVAVQSGGSFAALPPDLQATINTIAQADASSQNPLVQQAAKIRQASLSQQAILTQAASYKTLKTSFGASGFNQTMGTIAKLVAGNSIIGATRQVFYTQQGSYDFHAGQLPLHAACLQDLDQGLGSFFTALDEIGMSDQVLVCTHSDFNRTCTSNSSAGSDHGWGNHQLLLGGLNGGRVLGTMPALDLNGSDDLNGLGIWVPTTSVVQLASGIGTWMGLSSSQINTVFPELGNFSSGPLALS